MNRTKQHIRILLLLLLLGSGNQAWSKDITYHILNLGCDFVRNKPVAELNGSVPKTRDGYRIEALKCTVKDATTVELPAKFKSPLAKNFKYWKPAAVTVDREEDLLGNETRGHVHTSKKVKIYNHSTDAANEITEGSTVGDDTPTDIWVTYEYNDDTEYQLNGSKEYNIQLGNYFLAHNFTRFSNTGNRPGAILSSKVTNNEWLVSPTASYIADAGNSSLNKNSFYFIWKFLGEDPYNIRIQNCYDIADDPIHSVYPKDKRDSYLYGKIGSSMWLDQGLNYLSEGMNQGTAIYNSFALLDPKEDGTLAFMVANITADAPDKNDQYPWIYTRNVYNPQPEFMDINQVATIYPVDHYVFHVFTHEGNTELTAEAKWSRYAYNEGLAEHSIPEVLRRKYCDYSNFYAFKLDDADPAKKEAAPTSAAGLDNAHKITSYKAAFDKGPVLYASHPKGDYKFHIYFDYTVDDDIPFQWATNYDDARWFLIGMDNNSSNMAYLNSSTFNTGDAGKHSYDHESQFAFVGDPYKLKIVNRKYSDDNSKAFHYIGAVTDGNLGNHAEAGIADDGYVWEIVFDDNTGDNAGNMRLRLFNTGATTPKYWGYESATLKRNETASRIKISTVGQHSYTYHIVNRQNKQAIAYTVVQDEGTILSSTGSSIPQRIMSPLMGGATFSFWSTHTNGSAPENSLTETPNDNADIYVTYSDVTYGGGTYTVQLNGEYIYYDGTANINHSEAIDEGNIIKYTWRMTSVGSFDPYAMQIRNDGVNDGVATDNYVTYTLSPPDTETLRFGERGDGTYFVALSGNSDGYYEIMAATGANVSSETYYSVGQDGVANSKVQLYSSTTYPHLHEALQFVLNATTGTYTYHLIDKQNKELLTETSTQSTLNFPAAWRSPLVTQYHYYELNSDNFENDPNTNELPEGSNGIYKLKDGAKELTSVQTHIYVTYDVSDAVNLRGAEGTTMYRLKYHNGIRYCQEDGSDGVMSTPWTACYPYANGEANFYIYGNDRMQVQMSAAASTRNRWTWFLECPNNVPDPYHVKVGSASTTYTLSTAPSDTIKNLRAYFHTYPQTYTMGTGDPETHIVTGLITEHTAVANQPATATYKPTEYMILGTTGNYKLLTVKTVNDGVNDERRYVNSFETYWKNNPTILDKLIDNNETAAGRDPAALTSNERNAKRTEMGETISSNGGLQAADRAVIEGLESTSSLKWHTYKSWGMTGTPDPWTSTSKKIYRYEDHWFQTIYMGEEFDLEIMEIDPVLVLLDQHGWEIMRKPIPSSNTVDADKKAQLYAAIRPYNSPMVKAYHFWHIGTKASGYHKYRVSEPITVKEEGKESYEYTSTDLTQLPPYLTSENLWEKRSDGTYNKSRLMDQYVTYEVKEEYAASYSKSPAKQSLFLIQQGTKYAKTDDGNTITGVDVDLANGGLSKLIVDNDGLLTGVGTNLTSSHNNALWYVKPNPKIDEEMGYVYGTDPAQENEPWTETITQANYDTPSDGNPRSNGFDPYNIQIESYSNSGKYFTIPNITSAKLSSTSGMEATYSGAKTVTLTDFTPSSYTPVDGSGHDNTTLRMTNRTFMAVQDANGNMRLMPRFDHSNRVTSLNTINENLASVSGGDDGSLSEQTTFMLRPLVYEYHILDHDGNEALRYRKGGEAYPAIPDHFQSPFAINYMFYKANTRIAESNPYAISEDELIDGSFAKASHIEEATVNNVYVRYYTDREEDVNSIMLGNWVSMKLNEMDVKYENDGLVYVSKPATMDAKAKSWQWKFLNAPAETTGPDPYALKLYNRNQKDKPMSASTFNGEVFKANEPALTYYKFALLPHYNSSGETDGYALAVAGLGDDTGNHCDQYYFLSGDGMNSTTAAKGARETNFNSEVGKYDAAKTKVELFNDVDHTYYYKVIRKDSKQAVSMNLTKEDARTNVFSVALPEPIQSPLLPTEAYKYWTEATISGDTYSPYKEFQNIVGLGYTTLLGLYNDSIYVTYDYVAADAPLKVTKARNAVDDGDVAPVGDTDYQIDLTGKQAYNLFWTPDNIFGHDGSGFVNTANSPLSNNDNYIWRFQSPDIDTDGNPDPDPYNFQFLNKKTNGALSGNYMLLKGSGQPHGVLAVSGNADNETNDSYNKLQGTDGSLASGAPGNFYLFALRANVIYRINFTFNEGSKRTTDIDVNVGEQDFGYTLEIPNSMKRPFCTNTYTYHLINDGSHNPTPEEIAAKKDKTTLDDDFLGDTYVFIKYTPDPAAPFTYSSDNATTRWYTLETNDGDPYLANFTFQRNTLAATTGRNPHYTNDYLWAIEGDPYGFYLHNRYATKNHPTLLGWNGVMTTADAPATDAPLTLSTVKTNGIYEMDWATDPASNYFKMHPITGADGLYVNNASGAMSLGATGTDWTLALNSAQLDPYKNRAGYVGGLTSDGVTAWDAAADNAAKQNIVYNDNNIVKLYAGGSRYPGYYRIHDPAADTGGTPFYMSGYTHAWGKTAQNNLHYHSEAETQTITTYGGLPEGSYENTEATRGDIPLTAAVYNPASIFYFDPINDVRTYIGAQGLFVGTATNSTNMKESNEVLRWVDIGGAVVVLRAGGDDYALASVKTNYLAPDAVKTKTIGFAADNELADNTKWCLQPANNLGLKLETNNGGDGYYYSTIFVPFDLLITTADTKAFICKQWDDNIIHLKNIGRYNTGTYAGNDQFIPAGTPVIVRTSSNVGYVTMTLPTTTPSSTTAAAIASTNIFTGQYLEQLLSLGAGSIIYTLGNPLSGLTLDPTDGSLTGTAVANDSGMGFYQNANYNKEVNADDAYWERNNRYVLHNKIYYAQTASSAREMGQGVDFIPVAFDDEDDGTIEDNLKSRMMQADGRVYDLQGRCVATEEMVKDGTWRDSLLPGVYILNGRKVMVK